jgi:hypothetical protein
MSKVFTWAEIEQHNKASDCFLVIEGKVYDITKFLADHPGGEEVLVELAGQCMLLCAQFFIFKGKKKKKKNCSHENRRSVVFCALARETHIPVEFRCDFARCRSNAIWRSLFGVEISGPGAHAVRREHVCLLDHPHFFFFFFFSFFL